MLDAAAIAFLFFVNLGGKMFQRFRCGFGFDVRQDVLLVIQRDLVGFIGNSKWIVPTFSATRTKPTRITRFPECT